MQKPKFSKVLVSLILVFLLLFTIGSMILFWRTGSEPAALIGAVFAACFGELWNLAGIKKKEIEQEGEEDEWKT